MYILHCYNMDKLFSTKILNNFAYLRLNIHFVYNITSLQYIIWFCLATLFSVPPIGRGYLLFYCSRTDLCCLYLPVEPSRQSYGYTAIELKRNTVVSSLLIASYLSDTCRTVLLWFGAQGKLNFFKVLYYGVLLNHVDDLLAPL